MKKFESLKSSKFNTLEKSQMSKLFGGLTAQPDECTGAGSSTTTYPTSNGPVTVTRTWSGDCLNQGGVEGNNQYYKPGSALDASPCTPTTA